MTLSEPNSRRVWWLTGILLFWAAAVVVRLFVLQVIDYGWLLRKAERQQSRTVEIEARRGEIFDRNLHPLAMSLTVDSVFAVPSEISDIPHTSRVLARVLNLDAADLAGRLRASRNFCWVARKITAAASQRLQQLKIHGIYFTKEAKRFYPKGELAAHVLGYVGVDGNGLGGLEQEFDREIAGHPGRMLVQVDAHQHSYSHVEKNPEPGENLVITIDQNVQYIVQQELQQALKDTHARRATGIVENPSNGEILALANEPSFNPNEYRSSSRHTMEDSAVSDVYEPGSTFKLVTISAALQEKLTRPDEEIDCQMGSIYVGGRHIHDHHPFGLLTTTEILQHSSDVGAIKLGLRLGDERMYNYIQAFGFGQPTGIELPGESRGLARPPQRWTKMSIGAISMGQEIAVTPLQIAALLSTMADGGVYHRPHLVLQRFYGDQTGDSSTPGAASGVAGTTQVAFHPAGETASALVPGRAVITGETANEMKSMMEQVVLNGTAKRARLNGYTAAGKTGTAQKVDPGTHAYSAHHYVASFGGFAPLNNPAVVILVVLDSPVGLHEGGEVAAPVFKRIAERVLPYLDVPHDVPADEVIANKAKRHDSATDARETSEEVSDPSELAMSESDLTAPPMRVKAAEPARPVAQTVSLTSEKIPPPADSTAGPVASAPVTQQVTGKNVVLDFDGGITVPDFSGKSVRSVSLLCQSLGLDPELVGSGLASSQQPPPGSRVQPGSTIEVRFGRQSETTPEVTVMHSAPPSHNRPRARSRRTRMAHNS